jgi:hypothetical protein
MMIMEKDLMVKTLVKKGNGFIVEHRHPNSISTGFALPTATTFEDSAVSVASHKIRKSPLPHILSKEELYEAMLKANHKNMTTEEFAVLMAPKVKRSVDPIAHHTWDICHSIIRKLAIELQKEGKISMTQKRGSKVKRFVYNLKEPKVKQ